MKVFLTQGLADSDKRIIQSAIPGVEWLEGKEDKLATADVVLGPLGGLPRLRDYPSVKLLQVLGSGVEGLGKVDLSGYRGVVCRSVSGAEQVASYCVSLVLDVLNRISLHDRSLKNGEWRRPSSGADFLPPVDLDKISVGYYGFGEIGQAVAKKLAPLLRGPYFVFQRKSKNHGDGTFSVDSLDDLFKFSRLIVVTVPLTEYTRSSIKYPLLSKHRDRFIVSISRAHVISEPCFARALGNGYIAGAGLDCWWSEPARGTSSGTPSGFGIHLSERVTASPHRGGYREGTPPHLAGIISNLLSVSRGRGDFKGVVDLEDGY